MSFKTVSAILKGVWLIEPGYARTHMPIVAKMLKGELRGEDFGAALYKERLEKLPRNIYLPKLETVAAASRDVYHVTPYTSLDRLGMNSIAMVDIIGPVLKYGDLCSYGTTEYTELMLRLASSPRVQGIVLNIDSPGGEASGTALFAKTIREVSKQKPVTAIVQDGMAASAAMWMASAAQEIYVAMQTDEVGSIGAYQVIYDYRGMLEQMGVKEHLIMAPQSEDKIKAYRDVIEKNDDTLIKEGLEFLVNDFIAAVKTGRGGRLKTDKENPFTGKMYRAAEAKKIGLIDGVKSLSQVVTRMEELINLKK